MMPSLVPVSYTHLDVYKRQVLDDQDGGVDVLLHLVGKVAQDVVVGILEALDLGEEWDFMVGGQVLTEYISEATMLRSSEMPFWIALLGVTPVALWGA